MLPPFPVPVLELEIFPPVVSSSVVTPGLSCRLFPQTGLRAYYTSAIYTKETGVYTNISGIAKPLGQCADGTLIVEPAHYLLPILITPLEPLPRVSALIPPRFVKVRSLVSDKSIVPPRPALVVVESPVNSIPNGEGAEFPTPLMLRLFALTKMSPELPVPLKESA